MRKAVLSPNPFPQAKQRFIVDGLPESSHVVTRDTIEIAIETADRPDGTKVPIGRTNPGEFKISIDLADDAVRDAYEGWANDCIDQGSLYAYADTGLSGSSIQGISPNYKRNATIVYHRLYSSNDSNQQPLKYRLIGCFITSRTLPDYQMDGKDMAMFEFNVSYDDALRFDAASKLGGQAKIVNNNAVGRF
jgi:hypothetical protein